MNIRSFSVLVLLCAAWFSPSHVGAITFTNDATISILNTNYDGLDLVVTNCTLTLDGPHTFATVLITAGGKLTHFYDGTGLSVEVASITNESQTLSGMSAVTFRMLNVVSASVKVWDPAYTILYTNGVDYTVSAVVNGYWKLARTTNSSIPDGASVAVDYDWQAFAGSGVDLFVSGDMTLASGGTIDAAGRGFSSVSSNGKGGSAGGILSGGGGGHGGMGGYSSSNAPGGATLSFSLPPNPGGAGGTGVGGAGAPGGGRVSIRCGGTFTLDGSVNAAGLNATNSRSGGGAGGGVWILTTNLTGSGSIVAAGGSGEPVHGGGGGGGRITLEFLTNTFSGSLSATGGTGWQAGGAGTVFVREFGTVGQLTLDNGGRAGAGSLLATSGQNLTVQGGASAVFSLASSVGELLVRSNSSLLPVATNNATLSLTVNSNATIEPTGKLDVTGRGYFRGTGLLLGTTYAGYGGGAGHGGYGGRLAFGVLTNGTGGNAYDSVTAPTQSGSGAAGANPANGSGGGVIRLIVTRNLFLDGVLQADATSGSAELSGGGAGGSIWVTAGGLSGSGQVTANGGGGGMAYGGGGAGGRVAIFYTSNNFAGAIAARGGNAAFPGGPGSIYLKSANQFAGDATFDNGGLVGGRSALSDFSPLSQLAVVGGASVMLSNSSSVSYSSILIGTNSSLVTAFSSQNLAVSGNVTIAVGGAISNLGVPNFGIGSGGGGHGGSGGAGMTSLGSAAIADNAANPISIGNGGGYGTSSFQTGYGRGGGVITMSVGGTLQLDGTLSVNGTDALTNSSGGGAGGSLSLTLGRFAGAGQLTADGGSGFLPAGGGGGGGRIAVVLTTTNNTFTGTFSAKGGNGYQRGGAGTTFYKRTSTNIYPSLVIDNGGLLGTNTVANVMGGYNAVDLTIQGGALLSSWSGAAFSNFTIRSNSVFSTNTSLTVLGNATIEATAAIRLDGLGGSGLGTGFPSTRGGAGHGGFGGGNASGGAAYDSTAGPFQAGSIGGGNVAGGRGGGFLEMSVQGALQLDGLISADGAAGDTGGGGSGGGVRLFLNEFGGTGAISAKGGAGFVSGGLGGGGGGGRIAVTWNQTRDKTNPFTGSFAARGGNGVIPGGAGTIYLKRNDQSVATVITDNGGLVGATNTAILGVAGFWNLSVLGGTVAFPSSNLPGLSNLLVGAGSQLTGQPGASLLTFDVLDSVTVASGGAINVDGKGYGRSIGISNGAGGSLFNKGAGGGYGGVGGASSSNAKGGTNYGSATQPVHRGSGGGAGANAYVNGCEGGGAIKLVVPGTLTIDGTLSASGNAGLQDDSGGGAGGSIWVMAKNIVGSGVIAADGGDGELYGGGGGGGGRIAVYAKTTNAFTGSLSALGGDGANAGQNGTLVFTTNLLPFSIVSYSPSGVTSTTVGSVGFNFNQLVDPATVTPSTFTLTMPTNYAGPQPTFVASASAGSSSAGPSFPAALNVPGDYTITVASNITDIFGTPLSQVYTGAFTVIIPTVEGYVRTTNGAGVAGVTVQTSGYLPTSTDVTGNYILGVPPGWTGSIVPSLGTNMFLPGSITLTNVTAQTTNQNFVMVSTILPAVSSGVSGTNLLFTWTGFSSVSYQLYNSSNLVDWLPWGDPVPGTNAAMQLPIPIGTEAQSFFRLGASN